MEKYFGITYCFDKEKVHEQLDKMVSTSQKGYVCVADGVTLSMSYRDKNLQNVLSNSALTICDSGWVPVYIKLIYGLTREQYSGSEFLEWIVDSKKYKLLFLGASQDILDALKDKLAEKDERISEMEFKELPFKEVSDFDYISISQYIKDTDPDIVLVSLGMPKQEFFMYNLLPYIEKGVLVGVGAAFKFHSGLSNQKRAPQWMIKAKIEWVHRIMSEPQKQIKRCWLIFRTTPFILLEEVKKKYSKV